MEKQVSREIFKNKNLYSNCSVGLTFREHPVYDFEYVSSGNVTPHYIDSQKRKTLFAMIISMLISLNLVAQDFEVNGIYYNITSSKDFTVEVTYPESITDHYSGGITIPESVSYNGNIYRVTSIGDVAFGYCKGLTSITIPYSVTSIGSAAFASCSGLTSITIPNSVTSIGAQAFEKTKWYNNQPDGVLYINSLLYCYKGDMRENSIIYIVDGTTSICDDAFFGCSGLTSVVIPNSVTSIGNSAFANCSGLTSVVIPNSVKSIGGSAFRYCTGLTSITIPNSLRSIEGRAFYGCTGLTFITIPNSVKSIFNGAFMGCTSLTNVTIPNSVTSIGEYAFKDCSGLTSITMMSITPPTIESYTFSSLYSSATLYVPIGSIDAYKNAVHWHEFQDIREFDPATNMEDIKMECLNLPIYNLQGIRMKETNNLPSGIYLRGGKKIMVK